MIHNTAKLSANLRYVMLNLNIYYNFYNKTLRTFIFLKLKCVHLMEGKTHVKVDFHYFLYHVDLIK